MTSETAQHKGSELSIWEINRQNRESYDYIRSLVSEDESPNRIGDEIVLRFQKGGKPLRGRLDKVLVSFYNHENPIKTESYYICERGLINFGMRSGTLLLSSGLQIEIGEYKERDDGFDLLKNEDRDFRTAAKVIADTVRQKLEAKVFPEA